jgi:hypothetical protein
MGEIRNVYKILGGKPEGKRPLLRPRRRWEDSIKRNLMKVGCLLIGFMCLRIGTNGEHINEPSEFHDRPGMSCIAERLSASEGLCSMKLISYFK